MKPHSTMASMQALKRCAHARSTETAPDPRAAFARQRPHVRAPRSAPLLATANGQLTAVSACSDGPARGGLRGDKGFCP